MRCWTVAFDMICGCAPDGVFMVQVTGSEAAPSSPRAAKRPRGAALLPAWVDGHVSSVLVSGARRRDDWAAESPLGEGSFFTDMYQRKPLG